LQLSSTRAEYIEFLRSILGCELYAHRLAVSIGQRDSNLEREGVVLNRVEALAEEAAALQSQVSSLSGICCFGYQMMLYYQQVEELRPYLDAQRRKTEELSRRDTALDRSFREAMRTDVGAIIDGDTMRVLQTVFRSRPSVVEVEEQIERRITVSCN